MTKVAKNAAAAEETGLAISGSGQSLAAFSGFQILDTSGIQFLNGLPLEYRANCEKNGGVFMMNNSSNEGDAIKMQVINTKIHEKVTLAEIFGEEDIVEVLFVDENKAISSILYRTYSKDNFLKLAQTLMVKKTPLATQIITAKMVRKTSNNNTYHIVEFSAENSTEEAVRELKAFYDDAPEAFTAFKEFE